jgi:ketosteroid isomerase-like protein
MESQPKQAGAEGAVRDYIAVYNTPDLDAFGRELAPEIVLYSPLFADGIRGRDGHRQINERFFKSMPDCQFKVINVAAKGDVVGLSWWAWAPLQARPNFLGEIPSRRPGIAWNLGLVGSSA